MILRRDPICLVCIENGDTPPKPSTVADHKIPFGNATSEASAWALFISMSNLRGICKRHHDEKTATQDSGFGNAPRPYNPQRKIEVTGAGGQQFISSGLPSHVLDKALGGQKELDELLKDLSE